MDSGAAVVAVADEECWCFADLRSMALARLVVEIAALVAAES
jgi:hypothetical protein